MYGTSLPTYLSSTSTTPPPIRRQMKHLNRQKRRRTQPNRWCIFMNEPKYRPFSPHATTIPSSPGTRTTHNPTNPHISHVASQVQTRAHQNRTPCLCPFSLGTHHTICIAESTATNRTFVSKSGLACRTPRLLLVPTYYSPPRSKFIRSV